VYSDINLQKTWAAGFRSTTTDQPLAVAQQWYALLLATTAYNNGGFTLSSTSTTSVVTIPETGIYTASVVVNWNTNPTGRRIAQFMTWASAAAVPIFGAVANALTRVDRVVTGYETSALSTTDQFTAGDKFRVDLWQSTTGSLSTNNQFPARLDLFRVA
jgi:hypothetical protein